MGFFTICIYFLKQIFKNVKIRPNDCTFNEIKLDKLNKWIQIVKGSNVSFVLHTMLSQRPKRTHETMWVLNKLMEVEVLMDCEKPWDTLTL